MSSVTLVGIFAGQVLNPEPIKIQKTNFFQNINTSSRIFSMNSIVMIVMKRDKFRTSTFKYANKQRLMFFVIYILVI